MLERIRAEKKSQLGKKYVESYIYKGDDNCYYEHINEKDVDITEGNLNVDNVRNYFFPLPSLAEQKRIVEKIDEIFVKL